MSAEPGEPELVRAAQRGDRAAMEALLARHEQAIYRFGLRLCGDEESAREVLQETMLAAFRSLPSFRGDAALSTWLYQIARSFCIKQRRKPRAEEDAEASAADAALADTAAAGPEAAAHARELGGALAAGIGALSPDHREALVLRDVEGLSAEEAAEVAGVEVGALKSRLHRARLELRANLAAVLGEASEAAPAPCPELASELSAYVSAEIDQAACEQIERHMAGCPRCRGACDALKRTVSLCRALPGGEVPPAVRAAVRRELRILSGEPGSNQT